MTLFHSSRWAWERIRQSQELSLRGLGAKLEYDYSALAKRLDLLKPSPEVHGSVDARKLPASMVGQLMKLDHADRVVVADRVADEGLNRAGAGEVAARKARGQGGVDRAKPAPTRKRKSRALGLRVEVTRAKCFDLLGLAEAFETAAAEVRDEHTEAVGTFEEMTVHR